MPGGCDVAKGAAASSILSQALLHAEVRRLYYSQGTTVPTHLISTLCPRRQRFSSGPGIPNGLARQWGASGETLTTTTSSNRSRNTAMHATSRTLPHIPQHRQSTQYRTQAALCSRTSSIHARAYSSVPLLEPALDTGESNHKDMTTLAQDNPRAVQGHAVDLHKIHLGHLGKIGNSKVPNPGQSSNGTTRFETLKSRQLMAQEATRGVRDAPITRVEKVARSHNLHLRTKRDYLVSTHINGWDTAVWDEILALLEKESQPLPPAFQALLITGHTRDIYELRIAIENATGDVGLHAAISIWRNPDDSVLKVYGLPSAIETVRSVINKRTRMHPGEAQLKGMGGDGLGDRVRRYHLPTISLERHEPKPLGRPRRWTKRSFLRHVVMLTTRSPSAPYVDKGQHVEEVAAALEGLFGAVAETNSVATELAFNRAIGYLLHHMRIPQAQNLLESMEKLGVEPTVGIYNLFVENCAERMDQAGARRYIHALLEHGHPNAETWGALVWLSATHTKLKQVYRGLGHLGYLDVTAVSNKIVPHLIQWALDPFYDRSDKLPSDTRQYIEAADRLFGPAWLSSEAVTSLLNVLGLRGWVSEAARLLDSFQADRSLAPSVLHLNMLLVHCKRLRLADTSVWLVRHASSQWGITTLTSKTYLHLFRTATTAKLYNTSKVIWIYASVEGQIHHKMMSIMHRSYVRASEAHVEDAAVRQRWRASFAQVVTGWVPPSDASFHDALFAHFGAQRALYGAVKAERPFAQMLEEALALDKAWIEAKRGKSNDLEWKMRNSIDVPLARLGPKEIKGASSRLKG